MSTNSFSFILKKMWIRVFISFHMIDFFNDRSWWHNIDFNRNLLISIGTLVICFTSCSSPSSWPWPFGNGYRWWKRWDSNRRFRPFQYWLLKYLIKEGGFHGVYYCVLKYLIKEGGSHGTYCEISITNKSRAATLVPSCSWSEDWTHK